MILKKKQLFKILAIAIGTMGIVFGFQNCGNVNISAMPSVEPLSVSSTSFKATACPSAQPLPAESTKFIFIMDMSVSNIGDWRPQGQDSSGNPYYFFVPEKGTDSTGARFDAVRSFITSCGNLSGNQFSIIGFANTAGKIVSTTTGTGSSARVSKTLKCNGTFTDPNTALNDLDALKQAQIDELPWYLRWVTQPLPVAYPPGILGSTNYEQALGCAEDMIVHDLQDPNTAKLADNYQVFFISDGSPHDASGSFCEDKTKYPTSASKLACYENGIQKHVELSMQAALGNLKKIKMYSIYYENPTYPSAQLPDIIKYMGMISKLGDTAEPIMMGSFFSQMAGGNNPLCELLATTSAVEYKPDLIRVINLTAKRVGNVLVPDSDMDGLSDDEEAEMGSNPLNPRSINTRVLDGICAKLGGKTACDAALVGKTCTSIPNSMGVSQCDLVALQIDKLYNHPDIGIDTDKDGMPDFIEILKGTDPGLADMHTDVDGDNIPNAKEIVEGRNPFFADKDLVQEELMDTKLTYKGTDGGLCAYGAWELGITSLPGARTKKYQTTSVQDSWGAHAEGENVFMIYYRSDPRNSGSNNIEFYKKIFKAQYQPIPGSVSYKVITNYPEILPTDFEKAGEVQP